MGGGSTRRVLGGAGIGGAIGFLVGGPAGALIGGTIGAQQGAARHEKKEVEHEQKRVEGEIHAEREEMERERRRQLGQMDSARKIALARRASLFSGQGRSTVLTGPLGLPGGQQQQAKTLLGA